MLTLKKLISGFFLCSVFLLGSITLALNARIIFLDTFIRSTRDLPPGSSLNARLKAMTASCESSISDCFALKKGLSWLDARTQYCLTGRIVSRQVLLGKDRWLFYKTRNDGDPIADYQGVGDASDTDRRQILDRLNAAKRFLNREGIRFVLMIPPNKEVAYSNKMPESVRPINPETRTDRLVAYLRENGFTEIVYPKQEILRERDGHQLYFKYDTHWNQLGAFIGEQQLLSLLFGTRESLADQTIEAAGRCAGDLAKMAQLQDIFDDDTDYRIHPPFPAKPSESRRNDGAIHRESIVLVGDSFRESLAPFVFNDFANALVVHRDAFSPDVLRTEKPDIFVFEIVERYASKVSHYGELPVE